MPRKHRRRPIKGGFWPFDSNNTSSGYGSSNSGLFSNLFGNSSKRTSYETSNSGSGMFGNLFGSNSSGTNASGYGNTASYGNTSGYGNTSSYGNTSGYGYGGRSRRRRMKGGFKDNTPTTGLAAHAAPISGVSTAKAHNWVGGRTKRRYKKGGKTHRHRKY